jgi:hypothetical protein
VGAIMIASTFLIPDPLPKHRVLVIKRWLFLSVMNHWIGAVDVLSARGARMPVVENVAELRPSTFG